jgi:hypothetical protein
MFLLCDGASFIETSWLKLLALRTSRVFYWLAGEKYIHFIAPLFLAFKKMPGYIVDRFICQPINGL